MPCVQNAKTNLGVYKHKLFIYRIINETTAAAEKIVIVLNKIYSHTFSIFMMYIYVQRQ